MATKHITLPEWEAIENKPAIAGTLGIWKNDSEGFDPNGPLCATGKWNLLLTGNPGFVVDDPNSPWEDRTYYKHPLNFIEGKNNFIEVEKNNRFATGESLPDGYVYGPEHSNWHRHIAAFRSLLAKSVAAGICTIEGDLAHKFAFRHLREVALV